MPILMTKSCQRRGEGEGVASAKREVQAQFSNKLQTWQSDLSLIKVIKKERWEIKSERKSGKWQWIKEGLKPVTWQMVLANWATESFGNSVAEFKYLRLSCHGSDTKLACSMGRVQRARSARRKLSTSHLAFLMTLTRLMSDCQVWSMFKRKERGGKWQWLREELEPMTWQIPPML